MCQFSWRLLKSLWSVGVRPSRFSAGLLGPVPLHRHMRKPRQGARYIDASRPWAPGKIHQLLARHVDFKCIRGRTGTINWETPWMIFSGPKAWWKNQGRFCWCPRLWGRQKLKIGIVRCEKTQVSSFQDVPTRHFTYWQSTAIIETQTLTL